MPIRSRARSIELARARDHALGIRPLADHVAERPELLGAAPGRGRDDRVERIGMAVRVTEDGHEHSRIVRGRPRAHARARPR